MALELEPLESEKLNSQPANFEPKTQETRYLGPEHRVGHRRKITDRRASLRFEPDKVDRRSHIDRRGGGKWNDLYRL